MGKSIKEVQIKKLMHQAFIAGVMWERLPSGEKTSSTLDAAWKYATDTKVSEVLTK